MPVEITMPKIGLTMTEAMIVEWRKQEGDRVEKGEIVFFFETEKVTYEVEAPEDGLLAKIVVRENETVPVGTVVAYLLRPGESAADLESVLAKTAPPPGPGAEAAAVTPSPEATGPAHAASLPDQGRVKASPLVKKTAKIRNIDLRLVKGTGPGGMVTMEDLERFPAAGRETVAPARQVAEGAPPPETVPLTGMRRAIAKKMMRSKTETAQTYMTVSVDAGKIIEYRQKVLSEIQQQTGVRVTITDILMKITAAAIRKHPVINTQWTENGIAFLEEVHLGMAMALDNGLIVPVIREINRKNLAEVTRERQDLVRKGQSNAFLPDDVSGGTFTLSTLGMYGVEQFTANINVPENAILAVSAIMDKPVALGGELAVRPMMNLTLSYDHRTIDGAEAAKFMRTLKTFIEDPVPVIEGPRVTEVRERKRVTVIGGGVAGYPAAIVAARLGAEVTLIEKEHLGGTCLNWGCIPTKALLQSGQVLKTMAEAETFGIACQGYSFDFDKITRRKDAVVAQLREGVNRLLAAKKVRVIQGEAALLDSSTVKITATQEEIKADSLIIATGSRPKKLKIEGVDEVELWDSKDFFQMDKLPQSVVIIGGGFIGVEFAQILHRLKVEVTILELMDHLLPGLDREIALALEKSIIEEGIKVYTGAVLERIAPDGDKGRVFFTREGQALQVEGERIIYSVGRQPDLTWLDPDRIGLARVRGALLVNERMETNVPGIYAAGDVAGGIMLAHVATAEGECAARNAMGRPSTIDYTAIPSCLYTSPEVGSVGLSEEEARRKFQIEVGRFSFHGCGKARVLDQTYGLVKIVAEKETGTILGVHIIGPHATDLIAEGVVAMSARMTAAQLAHAVHPHPTLSEAVMEAAMSLSGGAIHMP